MGAYGLVQADKKHGIIVQAMEGSGNTGYLRKPQLELIGNILAPSAFVSLYLYPRKFLTGKINDNKIS